MSRFPMVVPWSTCIDATNPKTRGDLTVASEAVVNLTDDTFESEVLNSQEPVLVDFWAEWCQPCKMLSPTMDEIADEYAGRAKVTKMNIDDNRQVATQFGIMSIPTVLLFHNGEMKNQFVGLAGKDKFTGALDELL